MTLADDYYLVLTDLDPQQLSEVGRLVYDSWRQFAQGQLAIGGKRLMAPTGKYASAIEYQQTGASRIAVIADPAKAKEIGILESGHGVIDMLKYLKPGTVYKIKRRTGWTTTGSGTNTKKIWGALGGTMTGAARTPTDNKRTPGKMNTSKTGPEWTIPAMPAYSTAEHMVDLIRNEVASRG